MLLYVNKFKAGIDSIILTNLNLIEFNILIY